MTQHHEIRCDECGRKVTKLTRRYRGHGYCSTCYARVFKRSLCSKCGELARLPRNDPNTICRHCETDKPCTRCGKSEYKTGKITSYGPACKACAVHFREPEPCESCGELSKRLSRVKRLGHSRRLCPTCATADHGTCSACRRHRLLVMTPEGKKLCHTCHEQGEIICSSCGNAMPAGRGDACETCYWEKTSRKRLKINQAAFTKPEMKHAFGAFGEWLICAVGPKKAALRISHYLSFFLDIEATWQKVPSYPQLLNHFGAEGLRRVRLPMHWLHEAKGIEPDAQTKRLHSDKRRIRECLASLSPTAPAGKALHGYWKLLEARIQGGKTSYTSARLALRTAASLLRHTDPTGKNLPTQSDVNAYLGDTPGQAATLTGFTNYLNRQHGFALKAVIDETRAKKRRREQLAKSLIKMTKSPEKDEAWYWTWIILSLEYFHEKKVSRQAIRKQTVESQNGGLLVTINGLHYWIPID